MSGEPNSTEITALLINIEQMNALSETIRGRKDVIQIETTTVEGEINKYQELASKSKALIEGMDVKSPGNYGFEGRYHWFLLELVRQAGEPK